MRELYRLNNEDLDILEAAKLLLRNMTELGVVRPAQLVTVAKLLHVLWVVPQVCESVSASISIATRMEFAGITSSSCWQFSANEGRLEVSTGGTEYDPAIGSDSYSTMEWSICPPEASDYNGVWDERWMVPNLQYYPEHKLHIDLRSGDYTFSIEDAENELLGDC
jgi:hypothetical protein